MPAERWQSGINEFLQSIGETDDELIKMFMSPALSRAQKNGDTSSVPQDGEKNEGQKLPDILPILPLRGVVVYPNTAVPLTVGQARSIMLVDDVVGEKGVFDDVIASLKEDPDGPHGRLDSDPRNDPLGTHLTVGRSWCRPPGG